MPDSPPEEATRAPQRRWIWLVPVAVGLAVAWSLAAIEPDRGETPFIYPLH